MNLTISQAAAQPLTQTKPAQAARPDSRSAHHVAPASPQLASDVIKIKSGVLPTLKGAGLGLVGGGAGVLLMSTVMGMNKGDGGQMATVVGMMAGAVVGTIAGGVTANVSDNKWKASLIAAGVGAAVGVAPVLLMGGRDIALFYGAVGAVSGAAGGLSGALMAQRQ